MLRTSRIERWRGVRAPFLRARRGLPVAPFPDRDAIVEDAVRTVARLVEANAADADTPSSVGSYLDGGGAIEAYRARYESLARRRRAQGYVEAARARAIHRRGCADRLAELSDERWESVRGIVIDELSAHRVVGVVRTDRGAGSRDRRAT